MGTNMTTRAPWLMATALVIANTALTEKAAAEDYFLPDNVRSKSIVSDFLNIDRIYQSMIGPMDTKTFQFGSQPGGELIWLLGARIETVDKRNDPLPDIYLCHSNLDVGTDMSPAHQHDHQHDHRMVASKNFMDLVQGQPEIQFPSGFAIPLWTNDRIIFHSMALNSHPVQEPFDIKFRAILDYVNDQDLKKPLKPLGMSFSNVFVGAPHPNCPPPMMGKPRHECGIYRAQEPGGVMNLHWLVPPGRHTYRQKLSEGLGIPFDTTAHYISMHLHHHAESMELVDLTAKKTIFKGNVKYFPDKRDIERFEFYSSEEGVELYVDHEYELRTVYNNTTDEDIDAMAVLYIYYWDKSFDKNNLGPRIALGPPPEGP